MSRRHPAPKRTSRSAGSESASSAHLTRTGKSVRYNYRVKGPVFPVTTTKVDNDKS